jgi:hypothetical protein
MKATDLHISDLDAILQCHEVLAFVAGQLGLSGYKIVHEAEKKDVPGPITSGYIGIEITDFKRSQKHAASIQQLIKPPAKYQAWFGYNFENSSGKTLTNLSVWFYCGTSNARKTVQKKLGKRRGWKLVPMESDAKPSDKYFLQYSRPAAKVNKDCEAFLAFIAPVIPEVETGG